MKTALPPASATRLSCSPKTIPSRARETQRAMAPVAYTPSLWMAVHAAGALQHKDAQKAVPQGGRTPVSISTPPQAVPACSACRALSSPAHKRHNIRLIPACPCRGRSKTPDPEDRGFTVSLSGIHRQRKNALCVLLFVSLASGLVGRGGGFFRSLVGGLVGRGGGFFRSLVGGL